MSSGNVRVRVRIGVNEVEIEAPDSLVETAVNLIPRLSGLIPAGGAPSRRAPEIERPEGSRAMETLIAGRDISLPEIRVDKDDSLTSVILKIFRDPWGRVPRKLSEVREVLQSYGLIYPKQSVAVSLLRLAQSGKLRRFKGEEGDFVYTASTVLAVEAPPLQEKAQV